MRTRKEPPHASKIRRPAESRRSCPVGQARRHAEIRTEGRLEVDDVDDRETARGVRPHEAQGQTRARETLTRRTGLSTRDPDSPSFEDCRLLSGVGQRFTPRSDTLRRTPPMPDYDYQSDTRPFSRVLEDIGAHEDPKLNLGERGFGALMLFFGLMNVAIGIIPGTTTILGAPLLLMGVQLIIRQDQLWLPRWALKRSIDRETYRSGLEKVLPRLKKVERLSRPRLSVMTSEVSEVLIGIVTLLLSIILVLPIWGGNLIPALIIATFGFGLMQRDGLAIVAAWSAVALICVAGLVVWLAWTWVSPWLLPVWDWAQGLLRTTKRRRGLPLRRLFEPETVSCGKTTAPAAASDWRFPEPEPPVAASSAEPEAWRFPSPDRRRPDCPLPPPAHPSACRRTSGGSRAPSTWFPAARAKPRPCRWRRRRP